MARKAPTISLPDALDTPDILDAGRIFAQFPPIPGGVSGTPLTLYGVNLQVPSTRIGQVRVPLYAQIRAFRGHRDHGNTFNLAFHEDSFGRTSFALMQWQELVASSYDDSGLVADEYAIDVNVIAPNTRGDLAYQIALRNVWPQQVTPPASSETSTAARVDAVFSVDFVDLVAGGAMPDDLKGFVGRGAPWTGATGSLSTSITNSLSAVQRRITSPAEMRALLNGPTY